MGGGGLPPSSYPANGSYGNGGLGMGAAPSSGGAYSSPHGGPTPYSGGAGPVGPTLQQVAKRGSSFVSNLLLAGEQALSQNAGMGNLTGNLAHDSSAPANPMAGFGNNANGMGGNNIYSTLPEQGGPPAVSVDESAPVYVIIRTTETKLSFLLQE